MSRVAGKVVLVTGAGSGIGRATATLLAKEGATVVVTDINKPGGLETVQQIGGKARFEEHDTAREEDWKRIIDWVMAREGRLNGLVNNAGISGPFPSTFETETVEQWRRMLSINVEGVFLGCKYGVPAMKQSGGGSIVNTSSLAAFPGTPALSAYGASKGGVCAMVRALAVELARYNITANSILPGWIETEMTANAFGNEKFAGNVKPRIPERRWGVGADFGPIAVYLASGATGYTTGRDFVIDGGYTLF